MRWIICRARCSSSTCRSSSSSASAPSSRSSCASPPDLAFLRLVFAGTPEFAERALARLLQAGHDVALVLTQPDRRSEEHTSELQSLTNLVCRLLLEKKKKKT